MYADADATRCGYWLIRLRKGAPLVPARIWLCPHEPGAPDNILDTGPYLAAEVAGDPADPDEVWTHAFADDARPGGWPITEAEYRFRLADLRHARDWRPDDPLARPRAKVDWLQAALPF